METIPEHIIIKFYPKHFLSAWHVPVIIGGPTNVGIRKIDRVAALTDLHKLTNEYKI